MDQLEKLLGISAHHVLNVVAIFAYATESNSNMKVVKSLVQLCPLLPEVKVFVRMSTTEVKFNRPMTSGRSELVRDVGPERRDPRAGTDKD